MVVLKVVIHRSLGLHYYGQWRYYEAIYPLFADLYFWLRYQLKNGRVLIMYVLLKTMGCKLIGWCHHKTQLQQQQTINNNNNKIEKKKNDFLVIIHCNFSTNDYDKLISLLCCGRCIFSLMQVEIFQTKEERLLLHFEYRVNSFNFFFLVS